MSADPPSARGSLDGLRGALTREWHERGWHSEETIDAFQSRGAAAFPATRLVYSTALGDTTHSLGDVTRRGRRVAAGLRALGLAKGDAVVVQVPNWVEGAILFHACARLGLVVVPVIHIYGPNELAFILRDSQAKALVIPDRWGRVDYLERLAELGPALPDVVVVVGDDVPPGCHAWTGLEGLESLGVPEAVEPLHLGADVRADDCALILYTSGTSARPKGVRHSHNSILWEVMGTTGWAGWDETLVLLNPAPSGHMSGVLGMLRPFAIGATAVFMDSWDAARAVRLVDERGVTACTSPSPYFLVSLLDSARESGSALTTLCEYAIGGASVPPSVIMAAEEAGITAYRTYGLSEHPTVSSGRRSDPLERRAHSDGQVTPGCRVRVVDREGRSLPAGEEGELVVVGPEQFIGYTDQLNGAGAFAADGWFHTGDIGTVDEAGYLTVTDRMKDIIIRGGENISSREVEQVVSAHAAVVEAAAVAVPHPSLGESVGVIVVLRPGSTLELSELREHFRDAGLAIQKTPEHLRVLEDLPRTPSGKVRKPDLRRLFATPS